MSDHFVAAFEQAGDFTVRNRDDGVRKIGGNVATYFCTPAGRVIHAVAGALGAYDFYEAADWAVGVGRLVQAQSGNRPEQLQVARRYHQRVINAGPEMYDLDRLERMIGTRAIHAYLAAHPLPWLDEAAEVVFERLLRERFIRDDNTERAIVERLQHAAATNRRMLVHLTGTSVCGTGLLERNRLRETKITEWEDFEALQKQFVVVNIPINKVPALSSHVQMPWFNWLEPGSYIVAGSHGSPLRRFSDGRVEVMSVHLAGAVVKDWERLPPADLQIPTTISRVAARVSKDARYDTQVQDQAWYLALQAEKEIRKAARSAVVVRQN